jgi:hypothetical protein
MNCLKDSNGWTNGEAPSISFIEGYVEMGFPRELVVKGIKEIGNTKSNKFHLICHSVFAPSVLIGHLVSGHSDASELLELLLTYKVFLCASVSYLSYAVLHAWWQGLHVTIGHVKSAETT